ncbi:MAG TPA: TonB-dependent receptor plug domain-containing protein [Kofleriaceae bacterium]|jgi:outer membrane receptor protein involved in Fe transport
MRCSASYLIPALLLAGQGVAHAEGPLCDVPAPPVATTEVSREDTALRITGDELAARGATDLAAALRLIPELVVRDDGRGGFDVDIRGSHGGRVAVFIDGVQVSDPYDGGFDVQTVPITDIASIRVSATPLSPLAGPGGAGGVIEVFTRDANGPQLVIARVTADSLPTVGLSATARASLAKHLGIRISASGLGGEHDIDPPAGGDVDEDRRAAAGSARLEYRDGARHITLDGTLDDRHFIAPLGDLPRLLVLDRDLNARTQLTADDKVGTLGVHGEYFLHYLHHSSHQFADADLTDERSAENLEAYRSGGMLAATRPFFHDLRWTASVSAEHDKTLTVDQANSYITGEYTLFNSAAGVQLDRARFHADLSAGLAVPFNLGLDPWPEAGGSIRYKADPSLDLSVTGGYKGRVPTLRELFEPGVGNPKLGVEKVFLTEARAAAHTENLRFEVAPFFRQTNQYIGPIVPSDASKPRDLSVIGVDTQASYQLGRQAQVGASYDFVHVAHDDTGITERPPGHRFDAWARASANTRFSALARVRFYGKSTEDGQRLDRYALLEANLTAQLTPEYLVVLRGDDLLDAAPRMRDGIRSPGRVISLVLQGAWQ